MKIVTVCGLGVGTSLILKTTVSKAVKSLNINATIEHWDMGTIKGKDYDLLVTTGQFRKNFEGQDNVIYINNVVDAEEVKTKIKEFLEKNK